VSCIQSNGSPRPLISVFWPGAATFYSSGSSIDLTRLSGPRSRTTNYSENLVAPGIEPETSVSVARNHLTTEAVYTCFASEINVIQNIMIHKYKLINTQISLKGYLDSLYALSSKGAMTCSACTDGATLLQVLQGFASFLCSRYMAALKFTTHISEQ